MDLITKALCDGRINSVLSGVSSVTVNGTNLHFVFEDGTSQDMTFPIPNPVDGEDGISIAGVAIDDNNHLIVTYSNNTTTDAGLIPTLKGDKGDAGKDGIDGTNGLNGKDGTNGYTPIKGVDYFTQNDIDSIETDLQVYIDTQIGGAMNGSY